VSDVVTGSAHERARRALDDQGSADDLLEQDDAQDAELDRPHWLVRDPLRTAVVAITVLALAVRLSVLKDSFFITDDFMLSARAMENDFGWGYLTRVHTGHFEPIGFAVMWLLAHYAPLSWGWTVVLIVAAQVILAVVVWKLLVELFGRRLLLLVPFSIFCLTPLTMPAFTWLAAAIIWLPLMIAISGALRWHTRYVRTGRPLHALWATLWFVMGLASFEKIAVYLPFVVVFTLAVAPETAVNPASLWALLKRTRWVWVGYAVTTVAYLVLYVPGVRSAGNDSPVTAPSMAPLSDFAFLSVFRTFVPGVFGGPWDWQPTSYALAIVDSPRAFDWLLWILAGLVVVASLALRRNVGRFWLALLVYLGGSIATVAAGRVAYGGSIVALETRYLADAVIPLVVTLGACLMPLRGERRPWTPTARRAFTRVSRAQALTGLAVVGVVVVALSFHSIGAYARFSTNNPARAFVTNTVDSLEALPDTAEIYDTEVPGQIIGPLFAQYNTVSRYLSPLVGAQGRDDLYSRSVFHDPYVLNAAGSLVPMKISPAATSSPRPNGCYGVRNGRVTVPLTQKLYRWGWAVRIGYLADGDTTGTVSLGKDSRQFPITKGLGEVIVSLVGEGDALRFTGIPPGVNFCVGDAQVGFATPSR